MNDQSEQWEIDLWAAGWIQVRRNQWKCPKGYLWLGPYGAWCEMHKREREGK